MAKEVKGGDNSYGVVAFVFGILSILLAPCLDVFIFYGPLVGIILGILGIIFSLKQRKIGKNKWSKWALWLSIIGILLSAFILYSIIAFLTSQEVTNKLSELENLFRASQQLPQ